MQIDHERQKNRRPTKGNANKRTQVFDEVAAAVALTVPDAFHGNAHAVLMSIYKDPRYSVQVRMDAAKAAISFETPRLSAIEHKPTELDLSKLTDEQLEEYISLLGRAADITENARKGSMSPDKEIRKYHA